MGRKMRLNSGPFPFRAGGSKDPSAVRACTWQISKGHMTFHILISRPRAKQKRP